MSACVSLFKLAKQQSDPRRRAKGRRRLGLRDLTRRRHAFNPMVAFYASVDATSALANGELYQPGSCLLCQLLWILWPEWPRGSCG